MAPEIKRKLNKILAWVLSSAVAIITTIFFVGAFYSTTSATNKELPQHIAEDKMKENANQAFQNATLIKLENLTVTMNYFAKEMERRNNIEEKYHNQHGK